MQDIMNLNPDVLDNIADIIEKYILMQNKIIEDYVGNMYNLQREWDDDETIGKILDEIRSIVNEISDVEDEILKTYPKYFRERAEEIRKRPKL